MGNYLSQEYSKERNGNFMEENKNFMVENKSTYSRHIENGYGDFYTGLYKRVLEMAEIKGLILLFNGFGWTITIYAAFLSFFNVDTFTRSAFGFLGTVFLMVKIIGAASSVWDRHKKGAIERRMMLNTERERELKIRKEELDTYEKENAIIRNFNK